MSFGASPSKGRPRRNVARVNFVITTHVAGRLDLAENCDGGGCYKRLNAMLTKQSGAEYYHSIVDDILLMVSQMFAFHLILEIFEEKNRRKWYGHVATDARDDDIAEPEVAEERKRVEEYIKRKGERVILE